MNPTHRIKVVRNVLVPISLVADPKAFGGTPSVDGLHGDLLVIDGHAAHLQDSTETTAPRSMVLPRLVEPHCHLDKCHTGARLDAPVTSLQDAIALQARDKELWSETDLRHRIGRGLSELQSAGVGLARSHIDWADATPPLAWSVLLEEAQDTTPWVRVQPAALADIRAMADAAFAERIAHAVGKSDGSLGTFIYGQPQRQEGIRAMFRMADRFGLPLDFHVDEGMDPALDGLELIADIALETRHAGPVLCGHACALSTHEPDHRARVIEKLARAGISVVILPSTNLFLQDRARGPVARRGIAPIAELLDRGVDIAVGVDNVCDAFCPGGRHDPLWSLGLAILTGQLIGPAGNHLPMITTTAARALGHYRTRVDGAAIKDLLVVEAADTATLIGTAPLPRRSLSEVPLEALA
jgi:cytosine deaminase